MNKNGVYLFIILVSCLSSLFLGSSASAQGGPRIQKDALQHANWHTAPREFQIIDDRPVIKDFREAPQQAGSIELPPAPAGFNGSGGASGTGALGGGPGSSLPGSGLGLPGNGPAYRGSSNSLPKSGFGSGSNMAAHPGHLLPAASQHMINPAKVGAPRGMSPTTARTNGNSSAPVASYSGGYGSGSGPASGGSSTQTSQSVVGRLLKK